MPQYSVRIELHHAHSTDYHVLHKEMADRDFEQTIEADSGTVYHLPTAEYRLTRSLLPALGNTDASTRTLRFVHGQAKAAIRATVIEASINRVSHLAGSCITSQVTRTLMSDLEEVS